MSFPFATYESAGDRLGERARAGKWPIPALKYLPEIDLYLLTWQRAAKQGRRMIRLSDVKVQLQYRWRV